MDRIPNSVGGIAEETVQLIQPKTHKKYFLFGSEIKDSPQPWETNLQTKFKSCSNGEMLKQIESKPQDQSVEIYRTFLKDLKTAHCAWNTLQEHANSGMQTGHARATEKAKEAQAATVSHYLTAIDSAYQKIPEEKRKGLITPQEIRLQLFPKEKR